MNIIKYILLALFLWSFPTFALFAFGSSTGSTLSYLSFILLFSYYFLVKKNKPPFAFVILGLLYFCLSGMVNILAVEYYIMDFLKYFVLIICGAELVRNSTNQEFFLILLIGALSVLANALYFQEFSGGRYSGFYLNPNAAGFICICGYCMGYNIENKYFKLIGQFIFVFAGILTLSRTFIILWISVTIIAAFLNKKNVLTIGLGIGAIVVILSVSVVLKLDTVRFAAFEGLLENKVDSNTITEDSRNETWSLYTDVLLDGVLFGHGYRALHGKEFDNVGVDVGVHNTYLMILGEAGIIPFLVIIFIYLRLFFTSITKHIKTHPEYSLLSFVLIIFLLTSHNYFDNFTLLTVTIWLYLRVYEKKNIQENKVLSDFELT